MKFEVFFPKISATKLKARENYPMNKTNQEPITRSLHPPYKPLKSTLSDEKLFIEIVLAENLSRPNW